MLPYDLISSYRLRTFRTGRGLRLKSLSQAVDYVNERGFVYFWPITGITFPSLWTAVAGDRPVADAHDDPGHVTWGWKDSQLGKGTWYYGKVLRKKSTMISNAVLPNFYALSENYGSPEEDYLTLYEQGRLTLESKAVYEALLAQGPLDTLALRKATRLTSKDSNSRFERALSELQADFKILPVGVSAAGRWHYAFIYDIVTRACPDLLDQTRFITERQARRTLVELYFRSMGASTLRELVKLFGWPPAETERAVDELVTGGVLRRALQIESQPGEWIALAELAGRD